MSSGVKVTKDNVAAVMKSIAALNKSRVMVGVPSETAGRDDGGPVNNAEIGYIMETGDPSHNIPARPFLVPGVNSVRDEIADRFRTAGKRALDGDVAVIDKMLSAIGMVGQQAIQNKIKNGPFAPLAESTLRNRARRGRKGAAKELLSRAAGNDPDNSNARPLIDTGELLKSITYVLRRKGT